MTNRRYLKMDNKMYTSSYKIKQLIQGVKRRWKQRALKQGLSFLIFTFLFFCLTFLLIESQFEISPFIRGIEIVMASLALLFVFIQYIFRPLFKQLDNQTIALLIEEKIPELEDRLNSAVEINEKHVRIGQNIIIDQLIDDLVSKTNRIEFSSVVNRNKEKILSYSSGALFIIFLLITLSFFDEIKNSFREIEVTINPIPAQEQEFTTINPGNVQIEKGESQEIIVEMKEKTENDVMIHFYSEKDGWRKQIMERGLDNKTFMTQFVEVQEPMQYFVEFENQESEQFNISIYEFPKVSKINITYSYPKYTGLPDRVDENSGDIRALKGTKVNLSVETNGTAVTGDMILEDGKSISLNKLNNGKFNASITLADTNSYYIRLTDVQTKNNKFPEQFLIIPVQDEPPIVRLTEPQKDIRANMVEEVLVEANVSDDYGVRDFNLTYSVNGEEEKKATLLNKQTKNQKEISGSHVFFLEDYELQAGDVISYYVEANDNCPANTDEFSDMYFIEVTSLENRFSQVSNQGSTPGAGGRQSQSVINQQKIIAATWKLEKTKTKISKNNFKESLDAVTKAQKDLKENTEQRIGRSGMPDEMLDEESKTIKEYFKKAVAEMEDAVDELDKESLKKAVKEEQQALTNLLRAEAMNNEKRVQMQRNRGASGGSGSSNSQDRMEELQDLELDISKEKYETQQQRQQTQQNQEVDEALQKVQELAYRQQKLAERAQKSLKEEEDERFLDRLKREQEQLRQEAEELADQMRRNSRQNSQMSRDLQERMDEISQSMRNAEEALNKKKTQEAFSQQQMAINGLDRVTKNLQMSQSNNYREMTKNFVDQFDEFKENENNIEENLGKIYENLWRETEEKVDADDVEQLMTKRKSNLKNLEDLQTQAKSIEENTKREDPELSTTLRNFQKNIERDDLEQDLKTSEMAIEQGWFSSAVTREYRIQDSIDRLSKQVRQIESKLPLAEEDKLNRSLSEIRELLDKYSDIEKTARAQLQQQQNANNQNQQQTENSGRNQNQQNQGQRSQQQGGQQQQQGGQQQGQARGNEGNAGQRATAARLQRQMERMDQQLDELRRGNRDTNMRSALQSVQNNLNRLNNTGVLLDEAGLEYFNKNVYNPLSKLEYQLVKKLDEIEMDKKLYSGHKAEVPSQYQKIVEKYYESISKSKVKEK